MKVGDLIVFKWVYNNCRLNGQTAIYMGESPIHREDGVIVRNHKVLLFGDSNPTTVDAGLLHYMEVKQ